MGNKASSKELSTGICLFVLLSRLCNQCDLFYDSDALQAWQHLINMGFEEGLSLEAVKKYGQNIDKCIEYLQHKLQRRKKKSKGVII